MLDSSPQEKQPSSHVPARQELRSSVGLNRVIVPKSLSKVSTLRIRQNSGQKRLIRVAILGFIVRKQFAYTRDMAEISADAHRDREQARRHTGILDCLVLQLEARSLKSHLGSSHLGRVLSCPVPSWQKQNVGPRRLLTFGQDTQTRTYEPGDGKKDDVGRIRTYAPEGTRFLVLRDNHSATTPMVVAVVQLI